MVHRIACTGERKEDAKKESIATKSAQNGQTDRTTTTPEGVRQKEKEKENMRRTNENEIKRYAL
ncbi:hypothetical protein BDN70DRAFT_883417 [Pholiota conissans]|uniref:Uncharacterized protein n=1 Tax=Pholiota conissans TaxID=109636 RepID=A0A9P5YW06_9AGAR|nr:hypothetical protein BDN70DRAFT_883417 [Pholiota conissans]